MGEAADDIGIQCGGWTISWQGETGPVIHGGTTILAAIRNAVAADAQVTFSATGENVPGADAVLVVVGEAPYAEMKGDRSDLRLSAKDLALVSKARESGAPVITVLVSGRPLVLDAALNLSDALAAVWLPGTEGQGIADVLFGDYKPTGRLPRAWPSDNQQLSTGSKAAGKPLFKYGFGLTYEPPRAGGATAKTQAAPASE
jgi:beta-glucosidase